MSLQSTVQLLKEWARWGEAENLSYPVMSPMFGERALKTALYGGDDCPPDVLEVDNAVKSLTPASRMVIIQRFQRHLSYRELAKSIGVKPWTAMKLIETAIYEVDGKLQGGRVYGISDTRVHG